jgi:hypothetical protein
MTVLHTRRIDNLEIPGWGRWEVIDDDGRTVGLIAEHHRRDDEDGVSHTTTFDATHNPSLKVGHACWSSMDYASVPEALAALEAHLEREH